MPGFLTHYLFGRQILTKLDLITSSSLFKTAVKKHPTVFNLGTQGPDLFFYYLPSNFNPKKKLGTLMHQNRTGSFFANCLDYLGKPQRHDTRDVFAAYLAGMICHYALDSYAHPYIYARTGYDDSTAGTMTYLANHCQFESNLDSIMLQQLRHRLPSSFDASRCIRLSEMELHALASSLTDTVTKTFFPNEAAPYTTRGFMLRAIKHMPIKIRFLHDNGGMKRPVVEWMEKKTIKANILSCLFTIDEIKHPAYILNQNHDPWCNPWNREQCYSSSFLDIYLDGLKYTAACMQLLALFYDSLSVTSKHHEQSEAYKAELLELLGNCSYNSGLPLT